MLSVAWGKVVSATSVRPTAPAEQMGLWLKSQPVLALQLASLTMTALPAKVVSPNVPNGPMVMVFAFWKIPIQRVLTPVQKTPIVLSAPAVCISAAA